MVTVAIAGGCGNIGKTIRDVVKAHPSHQVIVLTRKAPEDKNADVPVFAVSYDDIEAVAKILESNHVHTVISAMALMTPEAGAAEVNLVKAAAMSSSTKRFIASDWGAQVPADCSRQPPQTKFRHNTQEELRKTDLEWTRFCIGFLLDFYGYPHIETYMPQFTYAVDMPHKVAGIPGTGNDPVSLIYSHDLAKFVVAAFDLPKWDEVTFCHGDKATWNQFLQIAEESNGSKFNVTYDSIETLEKNEPTELPSGIAIYAYVPKEVMQTICATTGIYMITGVLNIPEEKCINKLFPDIKTTSVKEMLSVWKGK